MRPSLFLRRSAVEVLPPADEEEEEEEEEDEFDADAAVDDDDEEEEDTVACGIEGGIEKSMTCVPRNVFLQIGQSFSCGAHSWQAMCPQGMRTQF
jgi:hypothetical protein